MLTLQRITDTNTTAYRFMEALLQQAFPVEEHRDLKEQRLYTENQEKFYNQLVLEADQPIGFFTYWDFDTFYYAEHFAISPTLRNGGYGKQVLNLICHTLKRPIVLEVEIPEDEMAKRRINFYQRNGFVLWENEYQQPPYRRGDNFLPMKLMVYGKLDSHKDYDRIKKYIYTEVYHVTE